MSKIHDKYLWLRRLFIYIHNFNVHILINVLVPDVDTVNWTPDYFVKNDSACKNILESSDFTREIPSLNAIALDDLRDGQLVRFRGMIQDMYNPEYYFQEYEVLNKQTGNRKIKSGMYNDSAICQVNLI